MFTFPKSVTAEPGMASLQGQSSPGEFGGMAKTLNEELASRGPEGGTTVQAHSNRSRSHCSEQGEQCILGSSTSPGSRDAPSLRHPPPLSSPASTSESLMTRSTHGNAVPDQHQPEGKRRLLFRTLPYKAAVMSLPGETPQVR